MNVCDARAERAQLRLACAVLPHTRHAATAEAVAARHRLRLMQRPQADGTPLHLAVIAGQRLLAAQSAEVALLDALAEVHAARDKELLHLSQ